MGSVLGYLSDFDHLFHHFSAFSNFGHLHDLCCHPTGDLVEVGDKRQNILSLVLVLRIAPCTPKEFGSLFLGNISILFFFFF